MCDSLIKVSACKTALFSVTGQNSKTLFIEIYLHVFFFFYLLLVGFFFFFLGG